MVTELVLLTKEQAYKPKVEDPRTRQRIEDVLAWVNENLSEAVPAQVHSGTLTKVFGPSGC